MTNTKRKLIGLTGPYAEGKGTCALYLQKQGYTYYTNLNKYNSSGGCNGDVVIGNILKGLDAISIRNEGGTIINVSIDGDTIIDRALIDLSIGTGELDIACVENMMSHTLTLLN